MSDAASKIMDDFFKHQGYLNSMADLIRNEYPRDRQSDTRNTLLLINKGKKHFTLIQQKKIDVSKAYNNLRNAWYHEAAFNQDNRLTASERMKFTAWKIIQFYYTIYCSLSAIVRCNNNVDEFGHEKMINFFTHNILNRETTRDFFPQPFCFLYSQEGKITPAFSSKLDWEYGLNNKCPQIEKCLSEISSGKLVSIFHYFLALRNWVNYEDAYIFRRLYSDVAKPQMYQDMQVILSTFNSITEVYIMCATSYEQVLSEARLFIDEFGKHMEPNIVVWNDSAVFQQRNRMFLYEMNKDWFHK